MRAQGEFDRAEELHASAKEALIGAHDTQTKLLSQEAGGSEMDVTFIMVHAQDTLMTAMMMEKQTRFSSMSIVASPPSRRNWIKGF